MKTEILQLSAKKLGKKSGIYLITCNNHKYVGSSKSLYARLIEHRSDLINNIHGNDFIQKAFNKYGIMSFHYEILEFCAPSKRLKREQYWINKLKPDFNLILDPINIKLHDYSKKKLGKSVKAGIKAGKYLTKFDFTTIEQYDYFGNFVKLHKDRKEAAINLKISKKVIQDLASGYKKGLSLKGVRLRYSNSKVPVQKFLPDISYLGKYFDFYYVSNNEEKFAFNSVKNVWSFLGTQILNNNREFKLIIKPKFQSGPL